MAFLLLLHEKMRLQRKVNKLTLRQTQLASRKERITKNIEKVQKMYSSKMTQVEKQASLFASQFKNQMLNSMGLGMQNQMFNPTAGFSGITTFVANQMASMLANGGKDITIGKDTIPAFNQQQYQEMMTDYMTTGLRENIGEDNKGTGKYGNGNYDKATVTAFMQAMQMAQQQQSQAQFYAQQMSSQYESNVSIWVEAYKAQLEEEQNAALLPLSAEETEMDIEQSSCEAQLADARARLDSIKQACSQEIKDSAPTFGLG